MLQELAAYARTHLSDSEPGFTTRDVRWSIELAGDGRFLAVVPLGEGKQGESLPRCPEMHGMNAGGKAHFLVETAQTAVLLLKPNEEATKVASAKARHAAYASLLVQASRSLPALTAIATALETESVLREVRLALTAMKVRPADWIRWRVGAVDPRLDPEVQSWWRTWREHDRANAGASRRASDESLMVCLITGAPVPPLATHPKISGLGPVGGLAMGDVLVGFDKAAFGSFGLSQSENAAMSPQAVQQYVDGLNSLVRNRSRRMGSALVTHWYKDHVPPADDPLAFLVGLETPEQTETAAAARVRRLLTAVATGQRPDLGHNRYYALTLSGAAGRVMVRDWMEGRFDDLLRAVGAWFSDLSIVAKHGHQIARDPKFMAVCGGLVRDLNDLTPPTVATLWQAAVQRRPVPLALMAQGLSRFRADVALGRPFNHPRMGLLKAYFVRRTSGGSSSMKPYLNPDHPEPAYHCGRLLAVLANLQHAALGDVGAGVVQRYYPAASQTPGLMLGRLAANARNHLGKLDPGLAWWYEERIADVLGRLGDRAPRTLDLEGQGLFALGYYQQLAALRAGKHAGSTAEESVQGDAP